MGPGDLVVCIDDRRFRYGEHDWCMSGLKKGNVYTVRERGRYMDRFFGRFEGIKVAELYHPLSHEDPFFAAARFRPVSRKSQETISSLLKPIKSKEKA